MDDYDYLKEAGKDYLEHHGVKFMKWGVKNGPPYPLEGEGKKSFRQQVKEAKDKIKESKAAKRRKKILKDPEKIVKYQDEFTLEDIAEAIRKIDAINDVKKRIPKKEGLTRKQKRQARDPATLMKNQDKFSEEDYEKAYNRLKKQRAAQDMIIDDAKRPAKVLGIANTYLDEIGRAAGHLKGGMDDVIKIHDNAMMISGKGKTYRDQYSDRFPGSKGGNGITKQDMLDELKKLGVIT